MVRGGLSGPVELLLSRPVPTMTLPPHRGAGPTGRSASTAGAALIGVHGVAVSLEHTPSSSSSSRVRSSSSTFKRASAVALTPSLAQIVDKEVTVEVPGSHKPLPFKLGGKQGNIITKSTRHDIHRGWRVTKIAGRKLQPAEVEAALNQARAQHKFTVTFRMGEPTDDIGHDQDENLQALVADRQARREASEAERRRQVEQVEVEQERTRQAAEEVERLRREAEKEASERAAIEEERLREAEEKARQEKAKADKEAAEAAARAEAEARRRQQQQQEEEAKAAAAAAAAKAAAAEEEEEERRKAREAQRLAQEERRRKEEDARREAERKRQQEEEQQKKKEAAEEAAMEKEKSTQLLIQRQGAEKTLAASAGLPPRDKVAEPQKALLAALTRPPPAPKKTGPCDKCDGPHHADDCPHFKKPREKHKDAWDKYGKDAGSGEGDAPVVVQNAKVIPQPGDGSCLFHSLCFGLPGSAEASQLRAEISDYIAANPGVEVAGNPIRDWVLWDSGMDTSSYARSMRSGNRWGGAVEIAVCAKVKGVTIDVYEKTRGGFVRISSFVGGSGSRDKLNLVYGGRAHYDALRLP